ncbi:MAG: inositol monophosphatase family protein [Opitutaceae bacterium]
MPSPELAARAEAARRAVLGQVPLLLREFARVESRWKRDGTRVTATDLAISERLCAEIAAQFPDDQRFTEESGHVGSEPVLSRFCWVLDPIDGTNNFALGIPQCAISLGLMERGQPVFGCVYDLGRRLLLQGGPEFGLLDGERRARALAGPTTKESLVGFHNPLDEALVPGAARVLSRYKIRALGSATLHLAYVAAGLLDGAIDYNVKIWDLAAALALCRGGGADVRFLNGEQLPMTRFDVDMGRIVYVAGAPALCEALAGLTLG